MNLRSDSIVLEQKSSNLVTNITENRPDLKIYMQRFCAAYSEIKPCCVGGNSGLLPLIENLAG